jgi:dTDP-4-dehydrorhamnose reductase
VQGPSSGEEGGRRDERALVLGATGMLGHEVVEHFARAYEVHATVRDPAAAQKYRIPATLHRLDASDVLHVYELADRLGPRVVVNCIGIVKQLAEGSQPIPTITVNALFPHHVAAAAVEVGARLIHVSTDCVFSGDIPLDRAYTEDDLPEAQDLYGRTKLLGEVGSPALTIRTSIIGWELTRSTGLLGWFATQRGAEVSGFTRAIFSGLTTQALAEVLLEVSLRYPELAGLYHVSADAITKHDLLRMIAERLQLDAEITPVDRPVINRALDSSRFRAATGIEIPTWDEMLDAYLVTERNPHEARA